MSPSDASVQQQSHSQSSRVAIEVKDLEMAYGSYVVMSGVTFTVQEGRIMVIMGGSGCGKSTLLRYLIGLKEVEKGEVFYGGRSFSKAPLEEQEEMQRRF